MSAVLRSLVAAILVRTPLGLWPIRVRRGLARGARWTLFPWSSYWRGTYEPGLQSELAQLGGGDIRGWACWDLGAHFGIYSIGLARRVGPTGEVAAFEPNPASYARLARHRRMNQLPWLKLYCAAASDHCAGAELYTYGNLATTTTHLPYAGEPRGPDVRAIPVRTVRLDDLVRRGELRPPQFVKIDVEGHGHHVLGGMREMLTSVRPIVVAGLHSPQEAQGMRSILAALGYQGRGISAPATNPAALTGNDYLFTPPA